MRPNLRRLFALLSVISLTALLVACGEDSDDDSTTSEGAAVVPEELQPVAEAPADANRGGELTVLNAGDIDYMDPGAAYYQQTYMVTMAAHRNLLNWQPGDLDQPSPDLATEEPEVSEDGRTITFTIHDGVRFSPPVDREVTSADVKYAIERSTLPGVLNQYVANYASDIEGYEEAAKEAEANPTGGAPEISGITTPDDTTLEIRLGEPTVAVASTIAQMLSLPVSAPGAGGVREGVRRQEPLDLRAVRGVHGAVHGRERPGDRRAHRLHTRQGDPHGPQPELGRRGQRRLSAGLPGRDHVRRGVHGHGRPRRGRSSPTTACQRRLPAAAECAQGGGPGGTARPASAAAARRLPPHRSQYPGSAVRRHQCAQGGDRKLGSGGAAAIRAGVRSSGRSRPTTSTQGSRGSRKAVVSKVPTWTSSPARPAIRSSPPNT